MYSDLDEFLVDLDKRRLLTRVADSVDPHLEIAAVTDRACKSTGGGPALLFERPAGYDIPVASNVYGSYGRMCLALGVATLDDLAGEIDDLMTPQMPAGIMDAHFCWKVGIPAYAMSSWIAWSRVRDQAHYLSDVIFGSALGLSVSRAVIVGHHSNKWTVIPTATRTGVAFYVIRK